MIVDTSCWKEFRIKDIFETQKKNSVIQVPTGASIPKNFLETGNIPRITVSNYNNGITGYYKKIDSPNYRMYENFISVSFLGTVFYHKNLSSLDMKVHCLKPLYLTLNEDIALFLVSIIKKAILKFKYSDQLSSKVLPELVIKLPVNELGSPDWEYMRNYIRNTNEKIKSIIKYFHLINSIKSKSINLTNWKKFNLYDENLFEIDSGSKLDKSKMTCNNPSIQFIGRSNSNNGITMIVDKINGIAPYLAGNLTLSLGGEYLGACFVQEKPFYTSQNVVVLKPKKKMSYFTKKFIATVIFKETQTHYKAFIDELNRHLKTDFSFYLPCKEDGTPNFEYMENYMKLLQNTINTNFIKLLSVIS